ncbi:MAG: hypothetical protein V3U96_00200 [Paracoccaceae bacterium]
MIILFIIAGLFSGALAGSMSLWLGGSMLLAFASYSVFGAIGAVLGVLAYYQFSGMGDDTPNWSDNQQANGPVSA